MSDRTGERDGQLVAACAAHRPALEAHARRMLRGREPEVPDVVQETLERLVRRFQEEPPPVGVACALWLHTALTNVCISFWRKQLVRRRAAADPALQLVVMPPPEEATDSPPPRTPLDTALDNFTNESFKAAVGSLSHKLRVAYELHLLGLSHGQIGHQLGLSGPAVRKRLHDARKHLRARLQLDGKGDEP